MARSERIALPVARLPALSPVRRFRQTLAALALTVVGTPEAAQQRQDVVRRALVAAVIAAILPLQPTRIPGWPVVVGACGAVILYDVLLAYLVFVKHRLFAARMLGIVLDAFILMGASLAVFHEMGAVNSTSDIWLVFLVYIIIGGFTLRPIGSLIYTGLWIGWFALATLLFFPADSQYHSELPMRLVFFGTLGLTALGMAAELQKRRARLEQQNRQTMTMLARLVEARDTDAGAHLFRIQHFSRALARHIGLPQDLAHAIADASMMHDVGKANVPDSVLKKTGALSPDEWHIMQSHTLSGDRLLSENEDFELARQVARWHHEHWDGGGYPDGLLGEAIPLPARIVAVADVFDALISQRPYKDAWSHEAAVRELERLAGSHLDPDLVRAFVELSEVGQIQHIAAQIRQEPGGPMAVPQAA